MKQLWTTLFVNDLERSMKFYMEVLGLPLNRRYQPVEGIDIAFFGEGETLFELIERKDITGIEHSNYVSTGFQIENVNEFINHLNEKNIEILEGPFSPSSHMTFFYVEDPDGYKIQLVELS